MLSLGFIMMPRKIFVNILVQSTVTLQVLTRLVYKHMQDFQITYEGYFDIYVLWPFEKKLISLLLMHVSTHNSMVHKRSYKIS